MFSKFLLNNFRVASLRVSASRGVSDVAKNGIGVLGVPFGKGQKIDGLESAPTAFRESSLFHSLKSIGYNVTDYGNVCYEESAITRTHMTNIHNYGHLASNLKLVSEGVSKILHEQEKCLVLGGDHSVFTGSASAHLQNAGEDNVAVIYVDAHADINLPASSASGNFHGMCVALVAKELEDTWGKMPHFEWLKHRLPLKNIGYIGLRSIDAPELETLKEHNVAYYTASDVTQRGVADIMEEMLQRIDPQGNKSIHVSFDTDGLDPSEAPCTNILVRGGLFLREYKYIAERLRKTGRVRVVDWVELNPCIGSEADVAKTIEAANISLLSCFGNT